MPVDQLPDLDVDAVLYQSHQHWRGDRFEVLSERQREVPQVVLEHDPPRGSPTDTSHPVDDPKVLVVHVTHFNELMWDSGRSPTQVVEHGVVVPDKATYAGTVERGIVVANRLAARGRRLGADIVDTVRAKVPLDLVGMEAEAAGGLGEISPPDLPGFLGQYRLYFHPVRYTSLGLSLLEAMAVGLPVVGLATTELASVIHDGVDGFVDTDISRLVDVMHRLLDDPDLARRIGASGQRLVQERFGIDRFVRDWESIFTDVCG